MVKLFGLLVVAAAVAGAVAFAPQPASRADAPAAQGDLAPPSARGLSTPFGDAAFRWRCTTGLMAALGERADWPMRRVAALCLCAADRIREEGMRDIVVGSGDLARGLAAAEARLCQGRQG